VFKGRYFLNFFSDSGFRSHLSPLKSAENELFEKRLLITCVFYDCVIYLHYRNDREYGNEHTNNSFYFKTKQQRNVLYLFLIKREPLL